MPLTEFINAQVAPDERPTPRCLVLIWSLVPVTAVAWGALNVWRFVSLPAPGPFVAVLCSGALGMASAHSLCMRRMPAFA